jgi:hypothetical protein
MKPTTITSTFNRTVKEAWFGRDRVRGEEGLSLWSVLGGLLLAALIAVIFVIPSLLGAHGFALNGTARDNLDTAYPAVKVLYGINNNSFVPITASQLARAEPTLAFAAGTAAPATNTKPATIGYAAGDTTGRHRDSHQHDTTGQSLVLAAQSATGNCYWLLTIENSTSKATSRFTLAPTQSAGAVYVGAGTFYADAVQAAGSTCSASSPPTGGWSPARFPSIS